MLILSIRFVLHAPWCQSLKDKRSEIRRIISALKNKCNASVAESGQQDKHTLLEISLIALAFDRAQGDSITERVYSHVESNTEAKIVSWEVEYR